MQKKPFVLRVNPVMMNALEKWAADEFRSVNGQIEWILNRALKDAGRLMKQDSRDEDPEAEDRGTKAGGAKSD